MPRDELLPVVVVRDVPEPIHALWRRSRASRKRFRFAAAVGIRAHRHESHHRGSTHVLIGFLPEGRSEIESAKSAEPGPPFLPDLNVEVSARA
jgi:hypothetical protein